MNKPCEELIILLIRISGQSDLFGKLAPNCYQYKKGTLRNATRGGVNLQLDISDYIQHYIYFGFKDVSNDQLLLLAKENAVVLDVGGNIGYTGLRLAKIVGKNGTVHSFEPDSFNHSKYLINYGLNDLKNLTINKVGLGEQKSTVKLFVNTDSNRGGNRINNSATDNFEEIQIITLDDYVNSNALKKIDLIKIDVEGYELKVLKGAFNVLQKFKPVLFVEFDHSNLKAQNDSANELIDYLTKHNYQITDTITGKQINNTNVNDFLNSHTDIVCKSNND